MKRCPFCGSSKIRCVERTSYSGPYDKVAQCEECGARGPSFEKNAMEAWEKRIGDGSAMRDWLLILYFAYPLSCLARLRYESV